MAKGKDNNPGENPACNSGSIKKEFMFIIGMERRQSRIRRFRFRICKQMRSNTERIIAGYKQGKIISKSHSQHSKGKYNRKNGKIKN